MVPHQMQPPRHSLRVTILAAGADLCATRNRVPRRFRPFDMRVISHGSAYTVAKFVEDVTDDLVASFVRGSKI